MIENMLLQIAIATVPVLAFGFIEALRRRDSVPWIVGALYGATALLCTFTPYSAFGMPGDLRYVPLVLAFVYGGSRAGAIATAALFIDVLLRDGGQAWLAAASCVLAAWFAFLSIRGASESSADRRIRLAMIAGAWTALFQFGEGFILVGLGGYDLRTPGVAWSLTVLVVTHLAGIAFISKLHELFLERKAMKLEIERAQKLQSLGELAASIAHEVRNPLTVVRGFLQLFQKDPSFGNRQYLPLVLEELDRAETIIGDYLNYSKPKHRSLEHFDLAVLVERVVFLLQPYCADRDVAMHAQLDDSIFIRADKCKVQQALVNLIKNAVEATPKGGLVEVRLGRKKDKAMIVVSDSGRGMSVEELGRIGTYFYSGKELGTGIGTAVAEQIIRTMSGTILYRSELGEGTEVTVLLPASEAPNENTFVTG